MFDHVGKLLNERRGDFNRFAGLWLGSLHVALIAQDVPEHVLVPSKVHAVHRPRGEIVRQPPRDCECVSKRCGGLLFAAKVVKHVAKIEASPGQILSIVNVCRVLANDVFQNLDGFPGGSTTASSRRLPHPQHVAAGVARDRQVIGIIEVK